jgi:hypothetical protein
MLTGIPGGTYNVTAAYGGNLAQLFKKSSGTGSFTVATVAPTVTLSEPQGIQPNSHNGVYYVLLGGTTTLTANVSSSLGTPTGTITFMNGTTAVGRGTPDAHGNVSFNTGTLGGTTDLAAAGTYNLTAVYSGDQNFSPGKSSPAVTFQLIPPSVLMWASPTSVSTAAGTPVASTISIQSLVGFSAINGANITCNNSTMPSYSECTFNVPQPDICAPSNLPGNTCTGITTSVVTISTNIPVNIPPTAGSLPMDKPRGSPLLLAGVFGLGLLGLALRRRVVRNRYLLNIVCLALFLSGAVIGVTSCTNSTYTHTPAIPQYTTPSGTYNVNIILANETTGAQESLPFTLGVTIQQAK